MQCKPGEGVSPKQRRSRNARCNVEGATATCPNQNRYVRQVTAGLWDTVYNGAFGQLRGGLQASYTQRELFSALSGGASRTDQTAVLTSIRYHPF